MLSSIKKRKLIPRLLASFAFSTVSTFTMAGQQSSVGLFTEDLNLLSGMNLRVDPVFSLSAFGLAAEGGKTLASQILVAAGTPVESVLGSVAVCTLPGEAAKASPPELASGSCSSLPISPKHLARYDVVADPGGYFEKVVIEKGLIRGGFVVNPYQYTSFESSGWSTFRIKSPPRPDQLVSDSSYFAYRMANYIGDLKGAEHAKPSSVHVCEGITPGMNYLCDEDDQGIFAIKGVAMIALAKSCKTCTASERAYLAGKGITYLISTPKGHPWELVGKSYYQQVGDMLVRAGFDVHGIQNIILSRLVK
jgi:hypothetical protein